MSKEKRWTAGYLPTVYLQDEMQSLETEVQESMATTLSLSLHVTMSANRFFVADCDNGCMESVAESDREHEHKRSPWFARSTPQIMSMF